MSLTPCATFAAAEADFDTKAYLQNHCIRCHGVDEQNADRRFDTLGAELSDHQTAEHWQEILDVVNLGEMPPEDEPQPSADETKRFVATVTRQLELAREALASGGQERFRRLNRYEYRNTIRDLLGVNTESFDPTTSFPADDRVDGFDNIGEHLVLSDYLLQCYLEAASQSIDKAVQTRAVVEPIDELLRAQDMCRRKFLFRPEQRFLEVNPTGDYVDVGHSDPSLPRVHAGRFKGVPADGYYTIRVKAEGINREHPYAPNSLQVDRDRADQNASHRDQPASWPPGSGTEFFGPRRSDRSAGRSRSKGLRIPNVVGQGIRARHSLRQRATQLQNILGEVVTKVSSRNVDEQLARCLLDGAFRDSRRLDVRRLRRASHANPPNGNRRARAQRRIGD